MENSGAPFCFSDITSRIVKRGKNMTFLVGHVNVKTWLFDRFWSCKWPSIWDKSSRHNLFAESCTIYLLSRTKIHVKQVLIDYSINTNFTIMASIIMINNFKWGCLAIGIFQKYQLDHKFLCLLHTNKLPDICAARSRLRKSPRRVLQTNKHMIK